MLPILVIEDDKMVFNTLSMALTHFGHEVKTAVNGKEGIDKFDKGLFGLVITDINMPGIDGNGVASHIRKSHKNSTPIIGISGAPWLTKTDAFNLTLRKHFSIKTLMNTVNSLSAIPAENKPLRSLCC